MKKRKAFNPKRRIREDAVPEWLASLEQRIAYGGNPEHKRNPGDFGLTPPAQPRPDKTLCDAVEIFSRSTALQLLRAGIRKGLVSVQESGGFPQNIWAVTKDGRPLEAQLENPVQGAYHGYPMPETDAFRLVVLERWNRP